MKTLHDYRVTHHVLRVIMFWDVEFDGVIRLRLDLMKGRIRSNIIFFLLSVSCPVLSRNRVKTSSRVTSYTSVFLPTSMAPTFESNFRQISYLRCINLTFDDSIDLDRDLNKKITGVVSRIGMHSVRIIEHFFVSFNPSGC